MQRARRLASVAAVSVLAVAGLAACRSAPGVAAYVGSDTISEDRVDALYANASAELTKANAQVAAQQGGDAGAAPKLQLTRQEIVTTLVGLDVMRTVAKDRNLTAATLPADQVAQAVGLPQTATYVGLYSEYRGLLNAIVQRVKPTQPTEADLRDVYTRLKAGGALQGNPTFEQFQSTIPEQDQQTLQQNIALRNDLQTEAGKLDISVNPKYGTPELSLVSGQGSNGQPLSLVTVSFVSSTRSAPVVDATAAG